MSRFSDAVAALNLACLDEFGEPATYTPAGGSPYAMTGILDTTDAARAKDSGAYGTFFVLLSAFTAAPSKGDLLTIGSVSFVIRSQPTDHVDGEGSVTLFLRKA